MGPEARRRAGLQRATTFADDGSSVAVKDVPDMSAGEVGEFTARAPVRLEQISEIPCTPERFEVTSV